jgi:hypothetical protein
VKHICGPRMTSMYFSVIRGVWSSPVLADLVAPPVTAYATPVSGWGQMPASRDLAGALGSE